MPARNQDPWTKVRTRRGFRADEVRSTLQKEVRRGKTENAVMLAFEMLSTSTAMEELLWKRLLTISVEDVGMGQPLAPVIVNALYKGHLEFKRTEGDRALFAVHAVRYLCACAKDRSTDEMLTWVKMMDERGKMRPIIKDYGVDMHTARGRKMRRGFKYFMVEGTKVHPELSERNKTYRKRILNLLKESK